MLIIRNISNTRDSPNTEKMRELKIRLAAKYIFDQIRGVWIADEILGRVFDISSKSIADEILGRVFDISSQSKQNKNDKIYAN